MTDGPFYAGTYWVTRFAVYSHNERGAIAVHQTREAAEADAEHRNATRFKRKGESAA